ncbi:MAG: helix-turn-helix domain-containing protein [Alphaproteobacteria bacterium]
MQELADHLGVSLSAISKIEKGYRRVDQEQLVRVCRVLGLPVARIVR